MTPPLAATLCAVLVLAGCSSARPSPAPPRADYDRVSRELAELQEQHQVESITTRRFTHQELWDALEPLLAANPQLRREQVGRSAEGRPLYAIHYGTGPRRVLLWSQMHGDESTATMALADLVSFLSAEPTHPQARLLAERLSITAVPMLNPDGAERFQRRNAYGVDINRDARRLATPEAQALRQLQQRLRPEFGFNLHDQNVRTRVGDSDRLAAIALLAPPFDFSRADNPVRERAKRVAAVVRHAVEPMVAGHVARYDDSFNPRAFGDLMQSWGTSTVLIESGGWRDDPEKQYLRQVNFVALLTALSAIAHEDYAAVDPVGYESLPPNGSSVSDLLVHGGQLVLGDLPLARVDLTANFADPLLLTEARITEVGDLEDALARDTLNAQGLFLHPAPEMLVTRGGGPIVAPGAPASFTLRRAADPSSEAVWVVEEGRIRPAGEGE